MCINKITELNGFKGKRAGEDCFTWKLRETGVCVCVFFCPWVQGSGFSGKKTQIVAAVWTVLSILVVLIN